MQEAEWIKTLEDGRKVKFTYQELMAGISDLALFLAHHNLPLLWTQRTCPREDLNAERDALAAKSLCAI